MVFFIKCFLHSYAYLKIKTDNMETLTRVIGLPNEYFGFFKYIVLLILVYFYFSNIHNAGL